MTIAQLAGVTRPPDNESLLIWKAQPKQLEFLRAKTDEALFGGAAGGGKSDALMGFAIAYALKYKGAKILILRRTIAELQKEGSLIPRSHELLAGKGWRWNEQKKKWRAPNGSVIEFGYCESEKDVHQYQSAQYNVIIFDELTHFTEYQYTYMFSRCRSVKGYPKAIRAATNPGNVGHAWVKKRFIDAAPPGDIHRSELKNEITGKTEVITSVFIPAKVSDNKILMDNDPGYVLFLQSLPEKVKAALLHGDWDAFEGQYFTEWNRDLHTCKPFKIPDHWHRERVYDWGMSKPLAHYWIAISPAGRAYVYREYYKTGKTAAEAGRDIQYYDLPENMRQQKPLSELKTAPRPEKYKMTYADPSVFAKKGEGTESIGKQMSEIMGTIYPAKNERVNGWMAVRKWLSLAPDGLPWLIFFDTCINAIRTIPIMIHDDKYPEDLDSDLEDHAPDAIRYWAVMRHEPPKELVADQMEKLPLKDQGYWERHDQVKAEKKRKAGGGFMEDMIL